MTFFIRKDAFFAPKVADCRKRPIPQLTSYWVANLIIWKKLSVRMRVHGGICVPADAPQHGFTTERMISCLCYKHSILMLTHTFLFYLKRLRCRC